MWLLGLPLVLFRDIIELVMLLPDHDMFALEYDLRLRLVNRIFEVEVTKYFARHRLEGCIDNWRESLYGSSGREEIPKVPHDFAIRLLQGYMDRPYGKLSYMAKLMNLATDELVEQSRTIGKTRERSAVLRDACEALHITGNSHQIFREGSEWEQPENNEYELDGAKIRNAAFIVAIIMGYTDVEKIMLANGRPYEKVMPARKLWAFGNPIARAIEFGHLDSVKRIFDEHPLNTIDISERGMPHALRRAAGSDHLATLEFVLDLIPVSNMDLSEHWLAETESLAGMIRAAAENQRWVLLLHLLKKCNSVLYDRVGKSAMCIAAKHGASDIILKLIELGVSPKNERTFGCQEFPLREAVYYGHLDAVKILLDNGTIHDQDKSPIDILAQCVAQSGNFEVFELLRKYAFWKPDTEWIFLPCASSHGHLDFLRHAAEHRRIPRKNPIGPKKCVEGFVEKERCFDYICRVSILLAVVAGQVSIVRWFATEFGIDISTVYPDDGDPNGIALLPAAVDTGNLDMVRLLTEELNIEPLEITEEEWRARDGRWSRRGRLESLLEELHLSFLFRYPSYSYTGVRQALRVAKGLPLPEGNPFDW